MSNIPYQFYPIPHEFLKDEYLDDPIMMKLIRYIFKRIRTKKHIETFMNNRTLINIELEPFEFIFGRKKCATEIGCSEKEVRTRINKLRSTTSGHLRASHSIEKKSSTFTVYALMPESFTQIHSQQSFYEKGQQLDEEKGHKQDVLTKDVLCLKETSKKREDPVSAIVPLFFSNEEKKETQCTEDDQKVIEAYFETLEIQINKFAIKKWLKVHSVEKIVKTIRLMLDFRTKNIISNPGGWLHNALKGNWANKAEFVVENRRFIDAFTKENNVKILRINKTCATDKENGNDYQFDLDPVVFQREIIRKYKQG